MEQRQERIHAQPTDDGGAPSMSDGTIRSDTATSLGRPPLLQKSHARPASARGSTTPAFRGRGLSIDVNVPDGLPTVAMASPLAMFSTKKLQAKATAAASAADVSTDHASLSQYSVSPFLEYGMVISLVCDDRNGIVCAEGFASREIRLQKLNYASEAPSAGLNGGVASVSKLGLGGWDERRVLEEDGVRLLQSSFRDCLFEVVPKMTYDATAALEEMSAGQSRSKRAPHRFQHSQADLKFKSDAEIRLNAMMYRKLRCSQVIYGQTVQFRHVKTGQYMCLDPAPLPVRGGEHSKVSLEKGSSRAHFTILPRFKLRSKGAPVQLTDQLILNSGSEEQISSLYASSRQSSDGGSCAVVGSSVHSSQWRAILFERADDGNGETTGGGIRAGDCIRLLHLESTSLLQCGTHPPRELLTVSLQFRDDSPDGESVEDEIDQACVTSDSLWMVEKAVVYEGGRVKWKDNVCLRHVLTGKYLGVRQVCSSPVSSTKSPMSRRASTLAMGHVIANDFPDPFMFIPTAAADSEDQVGSDAITLLQHARSKTFVHSPETHASSMTDIRISSMALRDGEHNGSAFSVASLPGARDEDAFRIIAVPQIEIDDTLLLISYKCRLRQFVNQFGASRGDTSPTKSADVFDREEKLAPILQAEEAVLDLLEFCSNGIKRSRRLHRRRQSMFKNHQFVDLLMDMIKAPFDRFGGPFSIDWVSSYNPAFKKLSRNADDPDADLLDDEIVGDGVVSGSSRSVEPKDQRHKEGGLPDAKRGREGPNSINGPAPSKEGIQVQVMRALNRIIPAVNSLLVQIFCGHRSNEVYVAQRAMPILMELLGNGFQTSLPLSYLLRENRNLVESITAYSSIIRNFFELIKTRGRSIRYMQFLVALCTSRGRGVPKTQESICDLLFNPANGFRDFVIVPMRATSEGFEVFVGARRAEGGSRGKWIGLAGLYQDYYAHGKHRGLGQYCYGLLQLYVALCLDRNYVSIDYIQQTFPRESLLTAVKDVMLSRSLRAVLLDLIRVAYIDCEPQKSLGCPRFTRLWTEVGEKDQEVKLPSFSQDGFSPADLMFFAEMKDMCSSYFGTLHGRIVLDAAPANQLLLAMLKVSKKMVEFGMFSSHRELSGLVVGLVDLLDERSDLQVECSPSSNAPEEGQQGQTHRGRRWRGESNDHSVEPRRARESSVTDGLHDLFTTMMVSGAVPEESATGIHRESNDRGIRRQVGDSDTPLLLRLRNSALLDGALLPSTGDSTSHELSIARQYGVGSLIWNEHCGSSAAATSSKTVSSSTMSRLHVHGQPAHLHDARPNIQVENRINTRRSVCSPVPDRGLGVNHIVMEIKDEICAILLLVDSIRLDYQVSMFLAAFRSHHGDTGAFDLLGQATFDDDLVEEDEGLIDRPNVDEDRRLRSAGNLFADKASPVARFLFDKRTMDCKFSLSHLSNRNVNTVLMQMLMYEYPPLVSKSLELLLQQFNQHDQLLSSLQNLQLLVAEETIAIYNRLKDDVNDLRRLSETTEVWMDLTSKSDFENAEWACSLLRTIRFAVTKHTGQTAGSDNSSSHSLKSSVSGGTSRHASAAHFQRRVSSGILLSIDDTVGKSGLPSTSEELSSSFQRIAMEKSPPNRKRQRAANVYELNCQLGKVSHHSSCHELLPMAKSHNTDLQPQRKIRSHSVILSMVSEARRLLRNLRSAQYVISMMEDGAHFYEAHTQGIPSPEATPSLHLNADLTLRNRQRDEMRGVFEEALQFLCAFCAGDAENQSILGPHAPMIVQYVGDLETAQQVLVSMYASNANLCKTVPTEVVNGFVSRLVEDPTNPRYLFFLESIVLCDEIPIHENQLLVLFQLVKCLESGAILQFFDDPTETLSLFGKLFLRYNQTTRANSTRSENEEESVPDDEDENEPRHGTTDTAVWHDSKLLEYHVRLLHLFAACATGKNTRCQEICQQIIPLHVILDLLSLGDCSEGFQFASLRFLQEVYLRAEDVEIRHDDRLSLVFAQLVLLCERTVVKYVKVLHDEDVNRHAAAALQKSKRLRDSLLATPEAKGRGPIESKELYLLVYGLIPTIAGFMAQFPQYVNQSSQHTTTDEDEDNSDLGRLADTTTTLFAVSALGEWSLPEYVMEAADELCSSLDKLLHSERRRDNSLPVLWLDVLSRNTRPDLSRARIHNNAASMLTALDKKPHALPALAKSHVNESSASVTILPNHRTRRMRSRPEPSAAPDNGSAQHFSESHLQVARAAHNQLDKLSVVQPMVLSVRSSRDEVEQKIAGGQRRKSSEHERSGRRDACSRQKGLADPSPPNSSFPKDMIRRLGFQDTKNARHSLYSRHSALSIQCASTGKVNSSLFKNYQQQAAVRQQGAVSRHQRFEAFDHFLWRLCADPRVESAMREELNQMVDSILSVESSLEEEFDAKTHCSNVRLTFDQVVTKLVAHVQAFKDAHFVKTNLILLDVFCRMIYATEGDWERRHAMQIKLNHLKVTKLVVHLIATRDDDAIFERSVELGVALLDGMNAEVQESFYKHWLELSNGSAFVTKIQARIEKASQLIHHSFGGRSSHSTHTGPRSHAPSGSIHLATNVADKQIARLAKRRSVLYLDSHDQTPLTPPAVTSHVDERNPVSLKVMGGPMTLIFRFLQLLCEGHYLNAQRFLITQPKAAQPSVNLVEATTSFLLDTYLALADLDVGLIIQLFETITEFCQGPCIEAQETVANFKFFSTVNALLMHHFLDQNSSTGLFLVRRLRSSVVVTLLSLLEGRSDRLIHTQLVQELNFDALERNLVDVFVHFQSEYDGKYAGNVKCSDDFYLDMGFNIYFLLQQLADSFPSLASSWIPRAKSVHGRDTSELNPSDHYQAYFDAFTFFQTNSARVEIVWNHQRDGGTVSSTSHAMAAKQTKRSGAVGNTVHSEDEEGRLMAYYFPLHPICYCLTEQSKKKLVWHVSRGANKLHDFYARSDKLVDEMAHQSRLHHHSALAIFARSADLLKRISFVLAVAINLLVLMYYQADGIDSQPYAASRITFLAPLEDINSDPASAARIGLSIAGTVQLELCVLILLCYLVNSAPLLIKKGWKRRIRMQQDRLSKKKASNLHRTDADERETFQDTEQLLRSLRDREEEYDYLFLPHRQHTQRRAPPNTSISKDGQEMSTVLDRGAAPYRITSSTGRHTASTSAWERLWRFLFGPASVVFRNASRLHEDTSSGAGRASAAVTKTEYLQTVAISFYFLLRSPRVLYYMWQICIAILGSYVNNLFFAFHLLDVVNRYQELSNVLRSIVRPAKVLGVTLLLYLVVVYVFAIVGFYFFREDYNPSGTLTAAQRDGTEAYQCQRLFQCFLVSLDQGFKSNGGLGGYLTYHTIGSTSGSYARLLFDVLYNTILLIMLLNIVFGVIIDTFASLREADHEKLMDMQNRCFICSIDAYTFDRVTKRGFHEHIYSEHNMWHYLFLFVHIRKKPITEYNGLELYLAMRMAKKDVSFFPNRLALSLEKTADTHPDQVLASVPLFGSNPHDGVRDHAIAQQDRMESRSHLLYAPLSPTGRQVHQGLHAGMVQRSVSQVTTGGDESSRRVSISNHCLSPSHASNRSVTSKLDKLESTIQLLLNAQADLKEQHTRSLERQNELVEMLVNIHGTRPSSAAASSGTAAYQSIQTSQASNATTAQQQTRRTTLGIVQRSPPAALNVTAGANTQRTTRSSARRGDTQPRVFNFDTVVEDP